jgi:hypothetical protein
MFRHPQILFTILTIVTPHTDYIGSEKGGSGVKIMLFYPIYSRETSKNIVTCYLLTRRIIRGLRIVYLDF